MKKLWTILLVGILAISLSACAAKEEENSAEESSQSSVYQPSSSSTPSSVSSSSAPSSSSIPSSSSPASKPALTGISIKRNSEAVLRPGDTAVISVFLEPNTVLREDAANALVLVLDQKLGTVSGPKLGSGTLQFEVSGLTTGNAVATVQTKDGKIKSNPLSLNVVAVEPAPSSGGGEAAINGLTINLGSDGVLKPGDRVTIHVFVDSEDINQAVDDIKLVLSNPQIGAVSGPRISAGTLQYEISGLVSGSCTATVQTRDGSVSSNVINIAVVAF